jgi:hypothetical protein
MACLPVHRTDLVRTHRIERDPARGMAAYNRLNRVTASSPAATTGSRSPEGSGRGEKNCHNQSADGVSKSDMGPMCSGARETESPAVNPSTVLGSFRPAASEGGYRDDLPAYPICLIVLVREQQASFRLRPLFCSGHHARRGA